MDELGLPVLATPRETGQRHAVPETSAAILHVRHCAPSPYSPTLISPLRLPLLSSPFCSEQADYTSADVTAALLAHVVEHESAGERATLMDRVERGRAVLEHTEAWLRGVAVAPIEPDIEYETCCWHVMIAYPHCPLLEWSRPPSASPACVWR